MSAWIKQLKWQVEKLGPERASWYVVWNEPDGTRRSKSCGRGERGYKQAERLSERIKAELLTGTYSRTKKTTWGKFKEEYRRKRLSGVEPSSRDVALASLNHFERILKLKDRPITAITAGRIDEFVSERRKERGKKPGSLVSPATVNKDLRNIRTALNVAVEWGYLKSAPKIKMLREPKTMPTVVTPEHFAILYAACDKAVLPDDVPYPASEWWRGLLVMAQMTGWRRSELLGLRWNDVDLERGVAITRARENKGKRDESVALHPVIVDHLEPLRTFDERVFPWNRSMRRLYDEFALIQDEAGIHLPCRIDREHDCTPACHRYGFHDERRAFATLNADRMSADALQALMRHTSYQTTQRYINMARQLNPAVENLHVPDVLRASDAG